MENSLISSANLRKPSAEERISLNTTISNGSTIFNVQVYMISLLSAATLEEIPYEDAICLFKPHSSKHPLNFRYVGTVLHFLTSPEPLPD